MLQVTAHGPLVYAEFAGDGIVTPTGQVQPFDLFQPPQDSTVLAPVPGTAVSRVGPYRPSWAA